MREGGSPMAEPNTAETVQTDDMVDAGVHNYTTADGYIAPSDPLLQERLSWFQDQKLALMMHWGPYSQLGLVESWALSDEDADWSRDGVDWTTDSERFKSEYRGLGKTFNPVRFQPELWADLAQEGGFRYLVFTTKHHDGFCMFDSQFSDYRVTSPDCPFHTHPDADICKRLFDAFRARGLGIAAYFSKADWHTPTYWDTQGRTRRGPSSDPRQDPVRWESFVQFTHNQVLELVARYGKLDVLWFDAGWVCRQNGQDIRIEELMDKARGIQPWLLSADRTCGGICENYVTPEQCVPDAPLGVPWESCVTMGTSFSFAYEDTYKSPRALVHLLLDIVSKGGNLALNVGPQPDGRLPRGAIAGIKGLGAWLRVQGEGIYGTRPVAPYRTGPFALTQKGDATYVYVLHPQPGEGTPLTGRVVLPVRRTISQVVSLATGEALPFVPTAEGIAIDLPPQDDTILADGYKLT